MSLVLVGTSHRLSPVEERERDRRRPRGCGASSPRRWPTEARRSASRPAIAPSSTSWTRIPTRPRRARSEACSATEVELYRLRDEDAALHLFRVAAGLDSLVPGEGEILGQVRDGVRGGRARARCSTGSSGEALRAGKKVRTETAIAESPSSVSSAAAALAQQVFGDLDGLPRAARRRRRGERARGPEPRRARRVDRGGDEPYAGERATQLADAFDARAVPFDAARGRSSSRPTSSCPRRARPSRSCPADQVPDRKGRPLFVIDLAVPRDVDPAIAAARRLLPVRHRRSAGGRAREPERQLARGGARRGDRRARGESGSATGRRACDVVPAIASLRERAESIRSGELAKAESRLEGLSESERRTVESLTTQIVNKLLHVPIVRHEGGRGGRGLGLRRGRAAPVRPARRRRCCSASEAAEVGSRSRRPSWPRTRLRGPGIEIALVPITTAGDRDRTKPFGQIGERGRLRQGARGGAARRADRRRRALGEGHDLDGRRRPRRRRVPGAGGSSRRACAAPAGSSPGCGSGRRRCGAGRSCSRSSRRSRSSRCAGTSTRGCASAGSAGSTRSCSRRAGSTGSGSRARSATASTRRRCFPEAGQGALALQVRVGEEELVGGGERRRDGAPRRARARLRGRDRRRLPRADRRASRRRRR